MKKVRVRFAPSPTGGLHLGGIRTALTNYIFARQHGGEFVLRVEDTDQTRFVEGAEQYILDCLRWCGILPDESPAGGGNHGPYRQSERKDLYRKYAEKLVEDGFAYYAFDTPEEIENMREGLKAEGRHNLQYGMDTRMEMKNSLVLSKGETHRLISDGTPYVIRIKVQPDETVRFTDMIRGPIEMQTNGVDDKVLLKADGMPTYHLAVVVDDHLMEITHAFRGEEWLPSAPVHVLLYRYLGWEESMPQWAHFPLILKPDGNGKLSKRDGERLGFPVFALQWNDPVKGASDGFRELGFLPEAFLNMLAMLGWNDGSEKEIYSLDELLDAFSMERIHAHGAKFDFEKAKWFNKEWIQRLPSADLALRVAPFLSQAGVDYTDQAKLEKVVDMVKDRCTLLTDFVPQAGFFFQPPAHIDLDTIRPKWSNEKTAFFQQLIGVWTEDMQWDHSELESRFKELAATHSLKTGELMLPLRVMLVGGKFGPGVFEIASFIGREETIARISHVLKELE